MTSSTFTLDPTLAKDTVEVVRLDVCRVLLVRDKTYPWIILVPAIAGMRDLDDMSETQRNQVMAEVNHASKSMKLVFHPHKMNVAALGNVVEQLHIHVIARFRDDPAWPAPVWGAHPAVDYQEDQRVAVIADLCEAISVN